MAIEPKLNKLTDSISIYDYHPDTTILKSKKPGLGQIKLTQGILYLISRRSWAQKHSQLIREFFIQYYSATEDKSNLNSLQKAFQVFTDQTDALIGLAVVNGSIYAVSRGEAELWLIRENKVVKLISGLDKHNNMSGWIKEKDILLSLIGVFSAQVVNKRLQNVAGQLDKITTDKVSINQIFKSAGLTYPGVTMTFITTKHKADLPIRAAQIASVREKVKMAKFQYPPTMSFRNKLTEIKAKILNLLQGMIDSFNAGLVNIVNLIFARLPSEEVLYAVEQRAVTQKTRSRNRKILLLFALVLLIGLSTSIGYGVKQRRQEEWQTKFGNLINDFKVKIDESRNVAELNPNRARDLINQAGGLVEVLKERGLSEDQIAQMQNELGVVLGLASGKKDAAFKIWLNLNLVRADMQAKKMAIYDLDLAILDQDANRAIKIGIEDKSAKVLAGQTQLGQTQQIAIYAEKVFVLSDQGIIALGNDNQEIIIKPDRQWGQIFAMQLFAGNIYLASNTGVWKYPIIENGYGSIQSWLAEEDEQLKNGVAMTIDGFIWIATSDRIFKYTQGVPDSFQISNLETGFSGIKAIYADEDSNYLYVLEPNKKRIVLLDKNTGEYKEQYLSDEFEQTSDLGVKETERLMLVLAKDKILEVNLN